MLHTRACWKVVQITNQQKDPFCGAFLEPAYGLEPSTPSLPCCLSSQTVLQLVAKILSLLKPLLRTRRIEPLPPVAPLCSITVPSQLAKNARFGS
jgi:hypothetical protein